MNNYGLSDKEKKANVQEYNHALFNNMARFLDTVWEMNLDTGRVYIMLDKLTPQLTGRDLSLDELVSFMIDACPPEGRDELNDRFEIDNLRNIKEEEEFFVKTLVVDKYHEIRCVFTPVLNEFGEAHSMYMSIQDIQNVIDTKEQSKRNREELDRYLSSMQCGIIQYTRDTHKILYVNDTALHILGYKSIRELQEESFNGMAGRVNREDAEKINEQILNIKSENDVIECEYRVKHADGAEIICIGNARVLFTGFDEPVIQRSMIDVTSLRKTGRMFQETTEALSNAGIGLWSTVMDGGIRRLYLDHKAADLIGCGVHLSPEEAYAFWEKHMYDGEIERVFECISKVKEGQPGEVIYNYAHPRRGEITVRCGGTVDNNFDGTGVMIRGYHQDITEYCRRG